MKRLFALLVIVTPLSQTVYAGGDLGETSAPWSSYKQIDSWAPITSGVMSLHDGDRLLVRATITRMEDDDPYIALRLTDSNGDSLEHNPDVHKGIFDSVALDLYKNHEAADFALKYVFNDQIGGYFVVENIRKVQP